MTVKNIFCVVENATMEVIETFDSYGEADEFLDSKQDSEVIEGIYVRDNYTIEQFDYIL